MLRWLGVAMLLSGWAYAQNEAEPIPPPPPPPPRPPVRSFDLGPEGLQQLLERALQQGQPCAIPLTKVPTEPDTGFEIDRREPEAEPPMSRVRPPARPCSSDVADPDLLREFRLRLEDGGLNPIPSQPDADGADDDAPDSPAEPVP